MKIYAIIYTIILSLGFLAACAKEKGSDFFTILLSIGLQLPLIGRVLGWW